MCLCASMHTWGKLAIIGARSVWHSTVPKQHWAYKTATADDPNRWCWLELTQLLLLMLLVMMMNPPMSTTDSDNCEETEGAHCQMMAMVMVMVMIMVMLCSVHIMTPKLVRDRKCRQFKFMAFLPRIITLAFIWLVKGATFKASNFTTEHSCFGVCRLFLSALNQAWIFLKFHEVNNR